MLLQALELGCSVNFDLWVANDYMVVVVVVEIISCCPWQDASIFDCRINVDWYEGRAIFVAPCLPRF